MLSCGRWPALSTTDSAELLNDVLGQTWTHSLVAWSDVGVKMIRNEAELQSIIGGGETEEVEFKRQLDLESAAGKSEFIKDVVALANAARHTSFLLVGVDDDGTLLGVQPLNAQRLQQIVDTYIQPALSLMIYSLALEVSKNLSVQIVEVRPRSKPYRVAKPTEKLVLHEVYVRHGAMVVRATPEEIVEMQDESSDGRERRRLLRKAEGLHKMDKLEEALSAYSAAIEIYPSADVLFARGTISAQLSARSSTKSSFLQEADLRGSALQDMKDALALSDSEEFERKVRLARYRLSPFQNRDDLDWLQQRLEGKEAGELLYLQIVAIEDGSYLFDNRDLAGQARDMLDKAIALGYDPPAVYFLRAQSNCQLHNFGIALEDVDRAIAEWDPQKEAAQDWGLSGYQCLKALILSRMSDFDGAMRIRNQVSKETGKAISFLDDATDLESELLCRYAMVWEHEGFEAEESIVRGRILTLLARWVDKVKLSYPLVSLSIDRWLESNTNFR